MQPYQKNSAISTFPGFSTGSVFGSVVKDSAAEGCARRENAAGANAAAAIRVRRILFMGSLS